MTNCATVEPVPLATLAARLRELRLKAGMSQETLAARSHLALRTIARLEAADNTQPPNRSTVALIAGTLGVHPDVFTYDNGDSEAA